LRSLSLTVRSETPLASSQRRASFARKAQGFALEAPGHLKTRNQLAALGLRPGGPVAARVVWRNGRRSADLYDQTAAKPKRTPTDAQKAAIARAQEARRTCPQCGKVYDFVLPARWSVTDCERCFALQAERDAAGLRAEAASLLADPDVVILDTETTDLPGYVVEIAAVSTSGLVLLNDRAWIRSPRSRTTPRRSMGSGAATLPAS
jgi:hypothetical protein